MKYAVCIYNEDRWCPVDDVVEGSSLIEALSRIGDRYKTENLSYQEHVPGFVTLIATDYDEARKIQAIKETRGFTGLGLKEAKDAVETLDHEDSFTLGQYKIDVARDILRQKGSLKVEVAPDTHPGVAMLLKLQQHLGGTTFAR